MALARDLPRVGAQDRPVVAQRTAHVERPHTVGAHVAERHLRPCLPSNMLGTPVAKTAPIDLEQSNGNFFCARPAHDFA
jgi:hypothetical protein